MLEKILGSKEPTKPKNRLGPQYDVWASYWYKHYEKTHPRSDKKTIEYQQNLKRFMEQKWEEKSK